MFITWLINSSPNFSHHFLHHSYNGQFTFSGYADEKRELLTSVADRDKRPGFHLVAAHLNRELSGPSEQPDWFQFSLKCLNISLNIYTVCVFQVTNHAGQVSGSLYVLWELWPCLLFAYVWYGVAVIYCLNYGPLLTCQQKLLNSVPVYIFWFTCIYTFSRSFIIRFRYLPGHLLVIWYHTWSWYVCTYECGAHGEQKRN